MPKSTTLLGVVAETEAIKRAAAEAQANWNRVEADEAEQRTETGTKNIFNQTATVEHALHQAYMSQKPGVKVKAVGVIKATPESDMGVTEKRA
jgi:hypothetical protein